MSLSLLMLNAVIILASPYPPLSREREKRLSQALKTTVFR